MQGSLSAGNTASLASSSTEGDDASREIGELVVWRQPHEGKRELGSIAATDSRFLPTLVRLVGNQFTNQISLMILIHLEADYYIGFNYEPGKVPSV